MAELLRRAGYGHAEVFSRVFVDDDDKQLHWFYYVDAGPKTRVGNIVVEGAVKTDPEDIIERSGLKSGEAFDWDKRYDGEFHLLDTGAYAGSFVRANVDTKFHVPGDAPDPGGKIGPDQIDEEGNLVPRELSEVVDVKIHVVEAPSQQLRVRAGVEFDPTRIDTALSSRLWLRNLFGPWHHLVVEGRIGFGVLWRSVSDDPAGLYGEALLRYVKPMFLTRLLDFRMSARFRDVLYPGFHLRELTTGPGLRFTLAPGRATDFYGGGLFFDTDLLFRLGQQVDFGPFDAPVRDAFSLADDDLFVGGEVQASLIWDERDNQVEAMRGHLLALRTGLSPGGSDAWNRYWWIGPEARGFLPLSESLSLGARANANWVLLGDDNGVPLGPRLFGGGAFSHRGFGRHQLSPDAPSCHRNEAGALQVCQGTPVGGLSLMEASLEGRWLPKLKPYGAVVFGDLGGAGAEANPFDTGVSLAAGLGLRLRFWYLPAAFDFSYRILEDNEVQEPADEPFGVFFRLGEAF
jgi:outer membrane protein assembly factor BamA